MRFSKAVFVGGLLLLVGVVVWVVRQGDPGQPQTSDRGVEVLPASPPSVAPSPVPGVKDASAPKLSPAASPAGIELPAGLKTVLDAVRPTLPLVAEHRPANDEEAHHTSPELLESARALGDLAEYLEQRPDEFKAASVFYADCASDVKLMPAVRAVCYSSLMKKRADWHPDVSRKVAGVEPQIIEIAKSLSSN